ncbi:MAG: hypothetical protein JJU05_15405 [Verrucomicrobia bacterium]|nr:hypothetical protein [Verrucomicrobiota bacterium]MCH8527413.1 hypothetical protein [Kiritimatiellia bacterium]
MKINRFSTKALDRHPLWAGMRADLPIEQAAWVGPETWDVKRPVFLRLTREIRVPAGKHRFYLSADQRYQLWINGEFQGKGPDRSDLPHWSVAGYALETDGADLRVELRVWWLPETLAPLAQCTCRPGVIVKGEGVLDRELTTGIAEWRCEDVSDAVKCVRPSLCGFHVVGPEFITDLEAWGRVREPVPLSVLRRPEVPERHGARPRGWRMHPTRLPEQRRDLFKRFRLCSFRLGLNDGPWSGPEPSDPMYRGLRTFFSGEESALVMPAGCEAECLIDMGEYVCGYPEMTVSGGRQSELRLEWAESLFDAASGYEVRSDTPKGQRDVFIDKVFHGFGDGWRLNGETGQRPPAFWWRSGRFLRLIVRTGDSPLRLERFAVRRTGFPFQEEGTFTCEDEALNALWPILLGGLKHCAHEQWVDCPYYEQLSYVGDHTNTALAGYCLTRDDALTRRSLELFDWSRHENGWVAERYPSSIRQDSFTYSMLYPCLVRDYAYWRRDEAFVRTLLPGIRAMMHECLAWLGEDCLIHQVPGWSFVDWVPEWDSGCGPGVREGDSSLANLHLSRALRAWAEVEAACGEEGLIPWISGFRERLNQRIKAKYWSSDVHLMADDSSHRYFSEHAQVWSLESGILTGTEGKACLRAWLSGEVSLAPMSIYFSHYGLEALYGGGEEGAFFDRLRFWTALKKQGFHTTPERPEPSRSDCHGWGAHPLFHFFAGIAGIRPASPGFRTVRIAPMPGHLKHIRLSLPHPEGALTCEYIRRDGQMNVRIDLPGTLTGEFVYESTRRHLQGGLNAFTVVE